jgi:hypothetical protein
MVRGALKKRLHDAANTKGGQVNHGATQCTLGASYTTYQADGTVTLLLGLRLRSCSTSRRDVGISGSRTV